MNQVTHTLTLTAALILGFASPMCVTRNPQGPETPFDPIEPTEKEARPPPAAQQWRSAPAPTTPAFERSAR